MKRAVIVVDVQRDFCAGGALPASNTESLLAPLNLFINAARDSGILVVFTQDWHPPNHGSFRQNGGRWPVHCEAGHLGAELMPPLVADPADIVIHKGIRPDAEGYSAFEDTELTEQLHKTGVDSVAVCGIATEYCVRATALDAVKSGFKVVLLSDLIRPVDPKAEASVFAEMSSKGITVFDSPRWISG